MKYLIFALLAMFSFNTMAHEGIQGGAKPITVFSSHKNESLDSFVESFAGYMATWSEQNNAEMCGLITKKDDVFYIVLSTNYSQIHCRANLVAKDTSFINETVHTHLKADVNGQLVLSDATRQAEPTLEKQLYKIYVDGKTFSAEDYKSGPGYLVSDNKLWHQNGSGTAKIIYNNIL